MAPPFEFLVDPVPINRPRGPCYSHRILEQRGSVCREEWRSRNSLSDSCVPLGDSFAEVKQYETNLSVS